jgi:hypothetical protein
MAGLMLLLPVLARADTLSTIQPIVKAGDTVAGIKIAANGYFNISSLNDAGQLVFAAPNAAGGEALFRYERGQFTLIAAQDRPAPTGSWPKGVLFSLASMNQAGDVLFPAYDLTKAPFARGIGLFRWEATTQQVIPMVLPEMPALGNQTYSSLATGLINNRNEVAFQGLPDPLTGGWQVYFRGQDGQLQPVVQTGDALPGGGQAWNSYLTSLNDAGVVGLTVHRDSQSTMEAYVWEKGVLTPVMRLGDAAPGGGRLVNAVSVLVNNQNRNVLLLARVADRSPISTDLNDVPTGLYLYTGADGPLRPVLLPGQELPGGGQLRDVGPPWGSFSMPNETGATLFEVTRENSYRAIYQVDAEGQLSLVLQEPASTDIGTISRLGTGAHANAYGLGLNRQGQVALPVRFGGGQPALVLLTPVGP